MSALMPSLTIVTIAVAGSGIVNDGTINANLSGGTFIITDGTFTNASTGTSTSPTAIR